MVIKLKGEKNPEEVSLNIPNILSFKGLKLLTCGHLLGKPALSKFQKQSPESKGI